MIVFILKKALLFIFIKQEFFVDNQTTRVMDESCIFLLHVTHTHITVFTNTTDTLTTFHR